MDSFSRRSVRRAVIAVALAVVLLGGLASQGFADDPAAAAPAPAVNPLAAPENPLAKPVDIWVGKFSSDQMTVTVSPADSGKYTGTIQLQDQKFPFTASVDQATFKGQFDSDGNKFDFTAALQGDKLTLQSGGRQYVLDRSTPPPPVNPLANAQINPLANLTNAPTPANPATSPNPVPSPNPAVNVPSNLLPTPTPTPTPQNPTADVAAQPTSPLASADLAKPNPANHIAFTGPLNRPALVVQDGLYYRWALPAGWKANETPNGVDLNSPDGHLSASTVLILHAAGQTTPTDFINNTLLLMHFKDVQIKSTTDLPDEPSGLTGKSWKVQQFIINYTIEDGTHITHITSNLTCAILMLGNQYSALVQGYQAPDADYAKAQTWLPFMATSMEITNPSKLGMADGMILPRAAPLDVSALVEAWKSKGVPLARIVQAQQDSSLGYEVVTSPATGKAYVMPFEKFDAAANGYRNPDDSHEILKRPADLPPPQ